MSISDYNTPLRAPRTIAFLMRVPLRWVLPVLQGLAAGTGPSEPYISDRTARDIGLRGPELERRRIKWPSHQNRL
ncbi:hypothetical protein SAMN05444000_11089 [Shimia gijangensis]|uniref:Uncharacterized protein n=1 Tax=Shimia gijangensis TaxID=1470563 RepID=A0A1M6KFJ5_9RHOB|nr:hypothetical protein SAMN05444000_11089 [Shimia gijangensis]